MKLIIGKFYKIVFNISGKALTFQCKILGNDGFFIDFQDKFDKKLSYAISNIASVEEIEGENDE